MDVILTPHTEATIERIKEHKVVLAPQDTTTLNYYAHPATEGLGPINTINDSSMGLMLHDTRPLPMRATHWAYWMPSVGRETLRTKAKESAAKRRL